MSEVKRFMPVINDKPYKPYAYCTENEDGIYVRLSDYAELKAQRDALAAENAALKHEVAGEMLRAANDIAYAVFNLADMKVTDLKPGVIESTGPAETALIAERNLRDFAAQLRAGKDGE